MATSNMVTVTTGDCSADIANLFEQLVDYVNSYGQYGITMELRCTTQPGIPGAVGGAGPVNFPVNVQTDVGTVPNFVYVAPTDLTFAAPV
jgi:hypothetical protein